MEICKEAQALDKSLGVVDENVPEQCVPLGPCDEPQTERATNVIDTFHGFRRK